MMEYVIAEMLHIMSIVVWIGGVTFVTLITFPMILRMDKSLEMVMMFQGTEHGCNNTDRYLDCLCLAHLRTREDIVRKVVRQPGGPERHEAGL